MRLAFTKDCDCEINDHTALPLPRFHTKAPTAATPTALVDLDFLCPKCSHPWKEGLAIPLGKPKPSRKPKLFDMRGNRL